jgi:hypothetical protein
VTVDPSPRGRTRRRAIAVLFALALVAALAAVPASARTVTRHGAATLGPLASAADDSSGAAPTDTSGDPTTDTSGGDTSGGDTTDTSGDPTTDSSGDPTSTDGSGDSSSADGTTIDDGSSACDGTTGTTDTSGDPTTDGSGDPTSTDGSDTIAVCDAGSGGTSSTTSTGTARLTALHAAVLKHGGVRVTFRLDRAGRVALTLQAQSAGVSAGKRCVAPAAHKSKGKATSTAKKGKACTRATALGGSVPFAATAGANTTTLTRWRGHKLAAGTYTLTVTPRAKGARATTTTFHVAGR